MSRVAADAYIGLPWLPKGDTAHGVSCWGLVVLFYREQLGIALPNYPHAPDALPAIRAEIERAIDSGHWQLVGMPQDGDVVTMSRRDAPHHLGVFVAGRVLHITELSRMVVAQTLQQLAHNRWGRLRFWRCTP